MRTTIRNGVLFDSASLTLVGERQLTLEDGRILEVAESAPAAAADLEIDAAGRFLLPGFIDAHVHHVITTMDFVRATRLSDIERHLRMAALAEASLGRGFTTVRDTGGAVAGLTKAIAGGLCMGPRIVRAGRAISQTGGHGDVGGAPQQGACACAIHTSEFSAVADGADAVRTAVRRELRDGSQFVKIMTSGGVASPSDPFDSIQMTPEEVRAATLETDHRHTYTTSHAYQPEAIALAIENGVRCIEHGNLVDAPTARRMAELDVTLVPTLVTYQVMAEVGAEFGMPRRNLDKNRGVFEQGQAAIEVAAAAGVALGFGTDLLGEAQPWQNRELAIRAELQPPAEVLRSLYQVNARLCGLEGEIGVIAPGAAADILISNVDPLRDLTALARPETALASVIAGGRVVRSDL